MHAPTPSTPALLLAHPHALTAHGFHPRTDPAPSARTHQEGAFPGEGGERVGQDGGWRAGSCPLPGGSILRGYA